MSSLEHATQIPFKDADDFSASTSVVRADGRSENYGLFQTRMRCSAYGRSKIILAFAGTFMSCCYLFVFAVVAF